MTKIDDMLSAAALRLRDFGSSSGFTEQQLLAGLTVPATSDPIARRVDQRRLEIVDRHIRELLPVAGLILGNAEFPKGRRGNRRVRPGGFWPAPLAFSVARSSSPALRSEYSRTSQARALGP